MTGMQSDFATRVFLGSSTKMLPYARAVKRGIIHHSELCGRKYNPTVWDELPILRAGMYTLESLEEVARTYSFACLVYGPDDRLKKDASVIVEKDGKEEISHVPQFTPRDNVVFETGFLWDYSREIAHLS